jgi:hypothetical protein
MPTGVYARLGGHALQFKDLTGKTFTYWHVLQLAPARKTKTMWLCKCRCGTIREVNSSELISEKSKSCGCFLSEWIRKTKRLRPYESLYNWLKAHNKNRNVQCLLTYEQFVVFTRATQCGYCGDPITWTEFNLQRNGMAYNLDRKDPKQGYVEGNCHVCCSSCNQMKSNVDYEVFLKRIQKIYRNLYG